MNGYEKRTWERETYQGAQELFAEKGVARQYTDIAAKANVSRVTIFKYFGDKNTLAKEAMFSWIELLMSEYEAF
jgi:AcrR family transcriptional regulator